MVLPQGKEPIYSIEDIYNLPEGVRAELIDGQIYYMAPPSRIHQKINVELTTVINNYIKLKGGKCEVYPAPFGVYLDGTENNYLEPDISVICDPNKLNEKGCNGAPDWIIEITSPSNPTHDYIRKLNLYLLSGVKEYWIINPQSQSITVYNFETGVMAQPYTFNDKVKVNIYDDFEIDFNKLNI